MEADSYIVRIFREKFAADISEQDEPKLLELFRKETYAKKEVIFHHFPKAIKRRGKPS